MKAIVTGATGFIGRHLVDALAASGAEVHCLTRGSARADARAVVTFHQVAFDKPDLGLTPVVLDGADVVYHLAGATRATSAAGFNHANVEATERLLDSIVASGVRPRFVYVSSQAAAGPAPDIEHPKKESAVCAPIEDYGRSKLSAERLVAARAGAFEFTIVRPVAVYGPADRDFLSIFAMARRGIAVYPGIRHASVNVVFVGDLVRGIIAAATASGAAGKTYFLGDDTPMRWTEIYQVIAEVVGHERALEVSLPRALVNAAGQMGDVVGEFLGKPTLVGRSKAMLAMPRYWLCSSEAARRDIGFATPTSLRDGMRATYDWYLSNRWL